MVEMNFYPYSRGEQDVGIPSWSTEIKIEYPSEKFEKDDVEFIIKQLKTLYEKFDCDGVETELEHLNMELFEAESELRYLEDNELEELSKDDLITEETISKAKEGVEKIKELIKEEEDKIEK